MGHNQKKESKLELSEPYLKKKTDPHLARKIWHFIGVIFILIVYHNTSRTLSLQLITFFGGLFILTDILRGYVSEINTLLTALFRPIMRDCEKNNLAGTTYLILGTFFIMYLFPKNIVSLTLLFLAVADPIAGWVGVIYGKDKIVGDKSLQGFIAAFGSCSMIAGFFFFTHNMMSERLLIVSILAGLIGALSELIPVFKLDDNLTFPLLNASGLWLLFYLFGGF